MISRSGTMSAHPLLPQALQDDYRARGLREDTTLAEVVKHWAETTPERVAVHVASGTPITYADLWAKARRLAGHLVDRGVAPGEFVLAVQDNSWQGIVLAVAASIAGVAVAPLSSRVSPDLVLTIADRVHARVVIVQSRLLAQEAWTGPAQQLRDRVGADSFIIQGGDGGGGGEDPTLEALSDTGAGIDQRAWDPGRPCLVLSTGGTTGVPKSVMHNEQTLIYSARHFAKATGYSADDVHVAFGPYGHASGSLFEVYMPLLYGASVIPTRWKVQAVAELIQEFGGTFCITVGTHLFDLVRLPAGAEAQLASMRLMTSHAGDDSLYRETEERYGIPVLRVYGLSECMGHAISRIDDPEAIRHTKDGVPFDGIDFRIVDGDGNVLPAGQVGEYECRGPSSFLGYLGQPEVTAAALTRDGYYKTGDLLVYSAADGNIRWSGRMKEIIRRGGIQIDPIEMATTLTEMPGAEEVAVVSAPDQRLGELAVVVMVSSQRPTIEEVRSYLSERGQPKETLPDRVLFMDALPRTEFGKHHRNALKAWVAQQG
ncbi:class I adenylate-forming enzyme family protein [Granulicoccus phenolivorans]|uniref:class I adenylate-forming enzyme family protein n=1 Tax=Granulicoccus phenolivorans TaxID=266854 RepID=UPI001FDEDA59|nr:class I adenylate-forming enzyme family protein [Granulicoccus phenolivorans]